MTPLNFRDIRKVKDTKKLFEKISDDMDSSLVRNSQAQRSKSQECEDANNALTAMRSCFAHTSLDYVFHVSTSIRERPGRMVETNQQSQHQIHFSASQPGLCGRRVFLPCVGLVDKGKINGLMISHLDNRNIINKK